MVHLVYVKFSSSDIQLETQTKLLSFLINTFKLSNVTENDMVFYTICVKFNLTYADWHTNRHSTVTLWKPCVLRVVLERIDSGKKHVTLSSLQVLPFFDDDFALRYFRSFFTALKRIFLSFAARFWANFISAGSNVAIFPACPCTPNIFVSWK